NRFHEVAGEHQYASSGKKLRRFLRQPLDPWADCNQGMGLAAMGALVRRRHREAAVMTDQPALESMLHQPGVAIRAAQAESALPAQGERRIAAAVEKQQRLVSALEGALHCLKQAGRDKTSARRAFGTQIDGLH